MHNEMESRLKRYTYTDKAVTATTNLHLRLFFGKHASNF